MIQKSDLEALQKDDGLQQIASQYNVAQFVSFGPDLRMRHLIVRGENPQIGRAHV